MSALAPGDAFPNLSLNTVDGDVELRERWERGPLVVMFMRHFGCTFCREHLIEMGRAFGDFEEAGADVVAVFQYDAQSTQKFCDGRDVPFDCLGDPEREAPTPRSAWQRGSATQIVNPKVALRFLGAARHGVFGGPPRGGDVAQLPGTFVVGRDGRVVLAHYSPARPTTRRSATCSARSAQRPRRSGSPRGRSSRLPSGLASASRPPSASTRSARPRRPEPRARGGAADAVVGHLDVRRAVRRGRSRPGPRTRSRTWRRSSAPRRRRSTPPPRPARAAGRRARRRSPPAATRGRRAPGSPARGRDR